MFLTNSLTVGRKRKVYNKNTTTDDRSIRDNAEARRTYEQAAHEASEERASRNSTPRWASTLSSVIEMAGTKVVILCGGQGTRLKEETQFKPKPMVTIGGKPILWHIMKHYAHYGFTDFILCLGYKGEMIKDYFSEYAKRNNDFTVNLKSGELAHHGSDNIEDWNITFVDTGKETETGGRIKKIEPYIGEDELF